MITLKLKLELRKLSVPVLKTLYDKSAHQFDREANQARVKVYDEYMRRCGRANIILKKLFENSK